MEGEFSSVFPVYCRPRLKYHAVSDAAWIVISSSIGTSMHPPASSRAASFAPTSLRGTARTSRRFVEKNSSAMQIGAWRTRSGKGIIRIDQVTSTSTYTGSFERQPSPRICNPSQTCPSTAHSLCWTTPMSTSAIPMQ